MEYKTYKITKKSEDYCFESRDYVGEYQTHTGQRVTFSVSKSTKEFRTLEEAKLFIDQKVNKVKLSDINKEINIVNSAIKNCKGFLKELEDELYKLENIRRILK